MAATNIILQTAEVALVAATAKTVAQITAATNVRVRVRGWGCSFDGVSTTQEPVQCVLAFESTAGTGTSQAPVATDSDAVQTIQTAGAVNFTAEPTLGNVIDSQECHPQTGFVIWWPPGHEPIIGAADRIGITLTAPAAVNVRAKIYAEE